MGKGKEATPPAEAPKLSPEQMQIDGLSGAIMRADYAVGVLRKTPLTIENLEQTQAAIGWLEGVQANLRKELHDLVKRQPPPVKGK